MSLPTRGTRQSRSRAILYNLGAEHSANTARARDLAFAAGDEAAVLQCELGLLLDRLRTRLGEEELADARQPRRSGYRVGRLPDGVQRAARTLAVPRRRRPDGGGVARRADADRASAHWFTVRARGDARRRTRSCRGDPPCNGLVPCAGAARGDGRRQHGRLARGALRRTARRGRGRAGHTHARRAPVRGHLGRASVPVRATSRSTSRRLGPRAARRHSRSCAVQ